MVKCPRLGRQALPSCWLFTIFMNFHFFYSHDYAKLKAVGPFWKTDTLQRVGIQYLITSWGFEMNNFVENYIIFDLKTFLFFKLFCCTTLPSASSSERYKICECYLLIYVWKQPKVVTKSQIDSTKNNKWNWKRYFFNALT